MSYGIFYGFTAMLCPSDSVGSSDSVALDVTVRGFSFDPIPQHIDLVWQDITGCFISAGYLRVAALLGGLPHEWNAAAGTFAITGTAAQRTEIFYLLARNMSDEMEPERPCSVLIEFYLSHTPPQLVIHAHHKAVYSWRVDQLKPSPVFQFRAKDPVAC